jgi:hypothetical protein
MTKSADAGSSALPIFIIEVAKGVYAGSPLALRTSNRNMAGSFRDEAEALAAARQLGGQVRVWTPGTSSTTTTTTTRGRRAAATPAPQPVPAATPVRTKATRGPDRADVVALLEASGLRLIPKSSDHWVGPDDAAGKGPRLVLPRAKDVTRVYLYQVEDATVLGYRTPEQRKAQGLGKVSHVADVTELEQVRGLVTAVCEALGLSARAPRTTKATRPARSRRKARTPATGIEATTVPQDDVGVTAESGPVETKADVPGPVEGTVQVDGEVEGTGGQS